VGITYTLGGRKVSQKQFFDGIEGQIRHAAVDQVVERVRQVKCPEHGKAVEVSEVKETPQGFSFEFTGCCDQAIAAAQQSLS
jgi:hypothetical protein